MLCKAVTVTANGRHRCTREAKKDGLCYYHYKMWKKLTEPCTKRSVVHINGDTIEETSYSSKK